MATRVKKGPVKRARPINPGLKGTRNWMTAQYRLTKYSRLNFLRFWASLICMIFLLVLTALWLGGFLGQVQDNGRRFLRHQMMAAGFVVDHVDVVGEGRLRESDVRAALGIQRGDYLFATNLTAAKNRVESISWVQRAVVRRLWPDRIVVQIVERQPSALWQKDGQVYLTDIDGEILQPVDPEQYPHLMLVTGDQAAANYSGLADTLGQYPLVQKRLAGAVQMPSGRWDLIMTGSGARIKLPEGDIRPALGSLSRLHSEHAILDRDLDIVDMRLSDRLTLRQAKHDRS